LSIIAKPFISNATKFCVALSGLVLRWFGGVRATGKEKPGKPFWRPGVFLISYLFGLRRAAKSHV
ncbi:MAG TPA: hypothetical protein VH249_20500, partial [Xanthobacteraceae bacterium]|nr:hypothetical protein [Xanthobacteraceae bacterium]